ncbi:MAG: hypothetical protein VB876_17525 [Pirellulales bacterium]
MNLAAIVPFGEHSFSRGSGPPRVERGQMMLPPALFVHKADVYHPRYKKEFYPEKPQLLRPVARTLKAPRPDELGGASAHKPSG